MNDPFKSGGAGKADLDPDQSGASGSDQGMAMKPAQANGEDASKEASLPGSAEPAGGTVGSAQPAAEPHDKWGDRACCQEAADSYYSRHAANCRVHDPENHVERGDDIGQGEGCESGKCAVKR